MQKSKDYKDLLTWQKAHKFVLEVYNVTKDFPKDELYGLTSQFRRAAVSIAANLAEGFVKKSKLDKMRFYNISQGSINECSYYLLLSKDLNYLQNYDELNGLLNEVGKLLNSYSKSLKDSM